MSPNSTQSTRIIPFIWLIIFIPSVGQEKLPSNWDNDATLRSIFFIDHDYGWAVGDRGTILKTEDGGRSWMSISSPRDLVWTKVEFVDELTGWIAGGYRSGSLNRSVGIIIGTTDGGKTWKNLSPKGIPFIQKVSFANHQSGWAFCDSNALYPSGLLITRDGGSGWISAPGIPTQPMQMAWVNQSGHFSSISKKGDWFELTRTGSSLPKTTNRHGLQSIASAGDKATICIDQGKLYSSHRREPFSRCSLDASLHHIYWNYVQRKENRIWAVGSPGTIILRSDDKGESWKECSTGSIEPLETVFFLDEERGWAAGALGKILVTKDGGKSWTLQRNGKLQVGALSLASELRQVNIPALALLNSSLKSRTGVAILQTNNAGYRGDWQISQGLSRVGNSGFDCQVVDSKKWLLEITKQIRTWQPSVLLIAEGDPVAKAWVTEAISAAANGNRFPQLSDVGLSPWQVEKVVELSTNTELESTVSIDQYSAQLGRTVEMQSRYASELFSRDNPTGQASNLHWRTLFESAKGIAASQGITTGTAAYGHPNRCRQQKDIEIDNMQQFRSIANRTQSLQRLGRFQILTPLDEKTWLDQITAATAGFDNLTTAYFLEDLAGYYTQLKKPIMADHTERLILQKVLYTEVGERSLWKMIQRYGSEEANKQLNQLVRNRMANDKSKLEVGNDVKQASGTTPFDPVRPAVYSDDNDSPSIVDVTPASMKNAEQLIGILQHDFPELNESSEYGLIIAWLKSKTGNRLALNRFLDANKATDLSPVWQRRLRRERKLEEAGGRPHDSIIAKIRGAAPIKLDGELIEPCWQNSSNGESIKLSFDSQFLYIAGSYQLGSKVNTDPKRRRTRDESLFEFDRAQIFIDFDRDYCSGIELSVDTRGSCNDAIWRDRQTKDYSFDPTWYVASKVDGSHWRFEAAIPWKELPSQPVNSSTTWIISSRFSSGHRPLSSSVLEYLDNEKALQFEMPQSPVQKTSNF